MEVKDYIAAIGVFVSACLVVAGWFVSKNKDFQQEKIKLKNSRREELAKSFIKVVQYIQSTQGRFDNIKEFESKWYDYIALMEIYGTSEEKAKHSNLHRYLMGAERESQKAISALNDLSVTIVGNVRKEIGASEWH